MEICVFGFGLFGFVYCAYAFYIADRGVVQRSWLDWIYFTIMTASTVGYGDMSPQTDLSKVVAIFTAISGVVFTAFMVSVISGWLSPTDFQKEAGIWLQTQEQRQKRMQLSAEFIQTVFRHFLFHKKYCHRSARMEKSYERKCVNFVTRLRSLRKGEQWTKISALTPVHWDVQEIKQNVNFLKLEFQNNKQLASLQLTKIDTIYNFIASNMAANGCYIAQPTPAPLPANNTPPTHTPDPAPPSLVTPSPPTSPSSPAADATE